MLPKELADAAKSHSNIWYMFPNHEVLMFLAQVLEDPECLQEEDPEYIKELRDRLSIWANQMRDMRMVAQGKDVGVF